MTLINRNGFASKPDQLKITLTNGSISVSYERNRWNQPEILMATFQEKDVLAGKPVSDTARFRGLINKATGSPPLENEE